MKFDLLPGQLDNRNNFGQLKICNLVKSLKQTFMIGVSYAH